MNEILKQKRILLESILEFYKTRTENSNYRVNDVLKSCGSKNLAEDLDAHKKLNDGKEQYFSISRETFKLQGISADFCQTFLENLKYKKIILDYYTCPREPFDKVITEEWFKDNIMIKMNNEFYKKLSKELDKLGESSSCDIEKPKCSTKEGGWGYLKLDGKDIKIGKINTRKYKFVSALTGNLFGLNRNINEVINAVALSKDNSNSILWNEYTGQEAKRGIVENQRREFYRILKSKGMSGIIRIVIKDKNVRMERC